MRITGCYIESFGQFEKYALESLDHPLLVILGPNEAGKSTVFHFMVTMLYGFSPAEAQRHPYRPTDASSLGGRLEFRSGNTRCSVERRLKSTPRGILSIGAEGLFGNEESIRNRPLRMTGDVSRDVYESVYALTLQDMAKVSGRAWNSIQDRLLGGLNLDTVRIAREVIEELELEARRLWRPDRRGKVVARELADQLRNLRSEIQDARERDAAVRKLNQEIGEIRLQIENNEREARDLRRRKSRAERLIPTKVRLDRLDHLEQVAGDLSELECIPADPREEMIRFEAVLEEANSQIRQLEESIRSREEIVTAVTDVDRRLEPLAADIRALHSRAALLTQRRMQVEETLREVARLEAKRDALGTRLMPTAWRDDLEQVVRDLPASDLREALRRYRRRREELDLARARVEGLRMRTPARSTVAWTTVLALGLVLVVIGLVLGEPAVWGPAVAAAAVAAGFVLQRYSESSETPQAGAVDSQSAEQGLDRARQVVLDILDDLPLSAVRLDDPDVDIASDIETFQALVAELDTERATLTDLRARLTEDESQVSALTENAGLSVERAPEAMLASLFERLSESESRRVAAEEAARTLPSDRERLDEHYRQRESLKERRAELRARITTLGDGDYARGIESAGERMQAAGRAAAIRDELESAHPDLDAVRSEIRQLSDETPVSPEDLSEMEERLEEISRFMRDADARIATNETRIRSLLEQKSVADIESEAAMVQHDQEQARTERDRLMLLANIVRHADARFRDRHQPDVIRRASDIVSRLTGGRYGHIEVDEEDGSLSILEEHTGRRVEVGEPLSRGTLDQVYLALRLGLADHLDSSGDRLPLFLDEVLVNWDAARRRAACGMLSDLSSSRQVFFFTCHEWLAEEIEHRVGARVVRL